MKSIPRLPFCVLPALAWLLAATIFPAFPEEAAPRDIHEQSLPLRTALHQDPTLGPPLDRLVDLYRQANRLDELLTLYRTHLAQFPADQNAHVVLIRIQLAIGNTEALRHAEQAVAQWPDKPYFHFLKYRALQATHDPASLDALDKAIALEQSSARKEQWLETLLTEGAGSDRLDLVRSHVARLAASPDRKPEDAVELSRKMMRLKLYEPALEILQRAEKAQASPEVSVDVQVAMASAEAGLGRKPEAAKRLETVLSKVTPDYWRRPEMLQLRFGLVETEEERQRMIQSAREKAENNPKDEATALDLAQLLRNFDFRREALAALVETTRRIPASERLDRAANELFDLLRDERGREAYLAERLKNFPERLDLVLRRAQTLYLLARGQEASEEFEKALKKLEAKDRLERQIEMARSLRRSNLPSEAARIFEQAIQAAPARLDVRRELAEVWVALGQTEKARDLFTSQISVDAEIENLLDLVQFMLRQEMFLEAGAALRQRLEKEPANLDLRLTLLAVETRLGQFHAGKKLIEETRALADTSARYQRWLESAVTFFDAFEAVDAFLQEELERVQAAGSPPSETDFERQMIAIEAAARSKSQTNLPERLQSWLNQDLPSERRSKIRRKLVQILADDRAQAALLEENLKALAEEEPRAKDEATARLAALYARSERMDLASPLLETVSLGAIDDPVLLSQMERLYAQMNQAPKVLAALDRLTALDPTNRSHWERWLFALAGNGEEARLRITLRRLLAGVDRMPLSEETLALLRQHLADSHWRSVALALHQNDDASLREAQTLLEALERTTLEREQWLWLCWAKAYVLNRLGREKARDQALAELERVATEAAATSAAAPEKEDGPKKDDASDAFRGVSLPDGLTLSLAQAQRLLSAPASSKPAALPTGRQGPLPPFKVQWVFETDGPPPSQVLSLPGSKTLISDLKGTLYCLDSKTGKLLWQREGEMPPVPVPQPQYRGRHYGGGVPMVSQAPPIPLADSKGRIFVPVQSVLKCLSPEDGRLLWQASPSLRPASPDLSMAYQSGQPVVLSNLSVFPQDDRVVCFDAASGVAAAFHPETGKLVWERLLPRPEGVPYQPTSTNAGASLSGNRLLVYGSRTAILDAQTGEVVWGFDPARVRKFPLKLEDPAAAQPVGSAATAAAQQMAMQQARAYRGGGYQGPVYFGYSQRGAQMAYGQQGIWYPGQQYPGGAAFVSAGSAWAAGYPYGYWNWTRNAAIAGDSLVLFNQQEVQSLNLELPLGAVRAQIQGTLGGVAGGCAVLLQSNQIQLVRLTDGAIRPLSVASEASAGLYHVALDGSFIYVAGSGGLACFNAHTAQKVFATPWPKGIFPERAAQTPLPQQPGASPYFGSQGMGYQQQQGMPTQIPVVARAEPGRLLVAADSKRIVALVEHRAHGQ